MFCAIIIVPVAGIIQLGGLQSTTQAIQNIDPNLLNLFMNAKGENITFYSNRIKFGMGVRILWTTAYFGSIYGN